MRTWWTGEGEQRKRNEWEEREARFYLDGHLGDKDGGEDVVGYREEHPLLWHKERNEREFKGGEKDESKETEQRARNTVWKEKIRLFSWKRGAIAISAPASLRAAANTLKRHLIAKLNATFSKSCYDFNFNLPFDVSVQPDAKNSARQVDLFDEFK